MIDLTELWKKNNVMPVIVVDSISGKVIMLNYMNKEAFAYSLKTHKVWYSNKEGTKIRMKGERSGHVHKLISMKVDYSCNALEIYVEQTAYHSTANSRFVHTVFGVESDTLKRFKFGSIDVDKKHR